MIYYTIIVVLYIVSLLFIKPSPKSFRDKPITLKENFLAIQGTFFLGILLLTIHLFASDFTFLKMNEKVYLFFALNNFNNNDNFWIFQSFTHMFIHLNFMHLISNVFMLGLLSTYERRVGLKRFLIVLTVSGLFSGLSIFFYSENILTAGISGALFGIGVAFFTDEKNLTTRDWLYALLTFLTLAIMLSLKDFVEMQKLKDTPFQIDYIGHALGALGAIIYTRLIKIS